MNIVSVIKGYEITPNLQGESLDQIKPLIAPVIKEAINMVERGPDEYSNIYTKALLEQLQSNPDLQTYVGQLQLLYKSTPIDQFYLRMTKVSQMFEYENDPINFPRNFTEIDSWSNHLDKLANDQNFQNQYEFFMMFPVMANIYNRSQLTKVVSLLYGKNNPVVLDYGCSLNLNNKMLAVHNSIGFGYDEPNAIDISNNGGVSLATINQHNTSQFSKLVNSDEFRLKEGIGIDVFDSNDPNVRRRALSDSFYMSELLQSDYIDRFTSLVNLDIPNVNYIRNYNAQGTADIVVLSAVLYQAGEDVKHIIDEAKSYAKPDGLVMISDFVEINESGDVQFYNRNLWRNHFNVWVLDKVKQNERFKKLMSLDYGRCKEVVLQPAFYDLARARDAGFI